MPPFLSTSCLLGLLVLLLTASPAASQPAPEADFEGLESVQSTGPSAPRTGPDTDDLLAELARYAAKLRLSLPEEERSADIVETLAQRHPVRRTVVYLLNRKGGKLDRWVNRALIRRAWRKLGPLPNLAEVTPYVYRGGEPASDGWRQLSQQGVRTVVNLRMEDESERQEVQRLGMRYVSIPIPDTDAPTPEQAQKFLDLCNQANAKKALFFHCAAGTYRTGTMAALFRISRGVSVADALAEAATFGWKESWLNADKEADFLRAWAAQVAPPRAAPPNSLMIDRPARPDFGRPQGGDSEETP
ncbi:MAG: tyrosine-protein phosphatase [Candidatus Wallbacteria bacterium]|nr:tyrosine-protein phosphatase [Candidatus Wallbacteria bacterium]